MDRVFKSGASATPPSPPASPSTGYPIGGDPGTGTPATKPGPYWYHMITESLRRLLVASGLTPDHTNLDQVTLAVQELIRQAAGDYKASVRVATTANITALNGGAPNTLDGVTLVAGDRILVKDQTTGSQNGLYVVTTLGTGANGTWSRAGDADAAGELTSGAVVAVEEGSGNADSQWMLVTDGVITIGTTSLVFVRQGGAGQQAGEVCYFARNTAPTGFLKANGAAVSRTTYSALFAAIGTTFGVGDGSTTFNLPDMRGEFPRGWDDGRGVDSGRTFGTAQTDAMQGHIHFTNSFTHTNVYTGNGGGSGSGGSQINTGSPISDGSNGTPRTAAETRPRNIALLACIKF